MAKSIVIYPSANVGTPQHSGNGYSAISDTRGNYDTTAITHTLETSSSTMTSTFKCNAKSGDLPTGKIRINSISGGQMYLRLTTGSYTPNRLTLTCTPSISVNNSSYVNGTAYSTTSTSSQSNFSTQTFTISSAPGTGVIYNSINDANINLRLTSTGSYTQGSKTTTVTFSISAANLDLNYDDVFTCRAVVQSGYGVTSATPTGSDVVDGSNCTFSATVQSGYRFIGWYTASDFSGTPVSTSSTYTTTVTSDLTLYPMAEKEYSVHIYGETSHFNYTLSSSSAMHGEQVTLTVTIPSGSSYRFAGIYNAGSSGNKTSWLTNSNPYVFTMPANDVYLYVETGKQVMIYISCLNCSLSGTTTPITSAEGATETVTVTYDSTDYEFDGIFSDSSHTTRLTSNTSYTFIVGSDDIYLYAMASLRQQMFVKINGTWTPFSKVYVKENGSWVEKSDFSNVFDVNKNYIRIEL